MIDETVAGNVFAVSLRVWAIRVTFVATHKIVGRGRQWGGVGGETERGEGDKGMGGGRGGAEAETKQRLAS